MEIQISTQKIKGRFFRNLLQSPFAIFKGHLANWSLHVTMKNFTGQENITYRWGLNYGSTYPNSLRGSKFTLKIQPEQILNWSFIPIQSGEQQLELLIFGFDPTEDIVLDDYGSIIESHPSDIYPGPFVRYVRVFEVEPFRDIFLFWFAIVSTIGAIFEILTFFLK